jgi:hypothetical protein
LGRSDIVVVIIVVSSDTRSCGVKDDVDWR